MSILCSLSHCIRSHTWNIKHTVQCSYNGIQQGLIHPSTMPGHVVRMTTSTCQTPFLAKGTIANMQTCGPCQWLCQWTNKEVLQLVPEAIPVLL